MLRRLDAAGLLPAGADMARHAIPQEEAAELLAWAAANDSSGSAAGYLHKLREEFAPTAANRGARPSVSLYPSYRVRRGVVRAGIGYDTVWTGARPAEDESDAGVAGRLSYGATNWALAVAARGGSLREAQLVVAAGVIGAWAGRRTVGYGAAQSGGLVLDNARIDGGGLFLTRPLRLPVLGRVRLETHLSKIDNVLNFNGVQQQTEPWFWTARASVEPGARVRIGINRAMMFGGEGNLPLTARRIVRNLVGITNGEETSFANQIVSVDARVIAHAGAWPLTLYADWGADDAYGGWWHVPGIAAGARMSALPRADLSFGVERVEFARNLTTNSLWYQNAWFRGSWADEGVPLGHPLAGHGKEWRVYVEGGSGARGISFNAAGYQRWRGRQNLYAPERRGKSFGVSLAGDARINNRLRVVLSAENERGTEADAWTMTMAQAGVRYVF